MVFLNKILPERGNPSPSKIMQIYFDQLNKNNLELQDLKNAAKLVENNQGGLSLEETNELTKLINEHKFDLITNNEQIKKTLIEELKKK